MFTRSILEIDLNRIVENYLYFSRYKKNDSTIMAAVVKDNAYGLGDIEVSQALYQHAQCTSFFVAHGFEGSRVRKVAPNADIYVLQGPGKEDLSCFQKDNLIPVIASPEQLSFWNNNLPNDQKPALQIESGLNRLGFRESDIRQLSEIQRNKFGLILSHLACADTPIHPLNQKQLSEFNRLRQFFPKSKFSLSASDGFLLGKEFHFDVVRLGAALYGINPIVDSPITSRNIITVKAPILQIANVKPGDSIGYGADYQVTTPGKIAIVSIGYGDGVPRSFFPNGKLWLYDSYTKNRYSIPLAGRVSMDNLICDVSHIPSKILQVGNYLTLIDDVYTCDHFGNDCGTIGYEILSAIGHGIRFQRRYIKNF